MWTHRSLTRRQFLKTSVGTFTALAALGIPDLTRNAGATHDPLMPHQDFFNETNFPTVIQRQPGIDLTRDKTRLLLVFKEIQSINTFMDFLTSANLILEQMADEVSLLPNARINNSKRHFWVRRNQPPTEDKPIDEQTYQILAKELGSTLYWVGPVYRYPGTKGQDGLLCPSPNVLLLKLDLKPNSEIPYDLQKLLNTDHLYEIPERSKFLAPFRYFALKDPGTRTVYGFQKLALAGEVPHVQDARFENSPLLDPRAMPPDDPLYGSGNSGQWNLRRIQAEAGWAICSGRNDIVIFIIDEGVDTVDDSQSGLPDAHPDIRFVHPGINVVTMEDIDKTPWDERPDPAHGTWCAGIVGAITNNQNTPAGVAGIAGGSLGPADCNTGCPVYPLVFYSWPVSGVKTDAQVAAAFSFAKRVHKRELNPSEDGYIGDAVTVAGSVACLSFAQRVAWDQNIIDPAIKEAFDAGMVICVSSGNTDSGTVQYPASNPYVIACGASDKTNNNRVKKASGFSWGSSYGAQLSVVAPGVEIPTTDPQDIALGSPRGEDDSGNGPYSLNFWGTSAAAPHVAGVAALLLSKFPYMTPTDARNTIERTARKVGEYAIGMPPRYPNNHPNGTWHAEMGYGLISIADALNYPADVMIRDTLSDTGAEPSTGVHWESPDIVIRPNQADPFIDTDLVVKGQDNYLFVRVTNTGPGVARTVAVDARIVPYVGIGFTYPYDWKTNPTHVSPIGLTTTFTEVAPGIANQVIAKFRITKADVDILWDWSQTYQWHPCLLAEVTAENDFKYLSAPPLGPGSATTQRNNLAQRNLTVVAAQPATILLFPFIFGSSAAGAGAWPARVLQIDRGSWPGEVPIELELDPDDTPFLRAGKTSPIGGVLVQGGKLVKKEDGKRAVFLGPHKTILNIRAEPAQRYRLLLRLEVPKIAKKGVEYVLRISQVDTRRRSTVGGATLIISVT